jgi:hypothetical protein
VVSLAVMHSPWVTMIEVAPWPSCARSRSLDVHGAVATDMRVSVPVLFKLGVVAWPGGMTRNTGMAVQHPPQTCLNHPVTSRIEWLGQAAPPRPGSASTPTPRSPPPDGPTITEVPAASASRARTLRCGARPSHCWRPTGWRRGPAPRPATVRTHQTMTQAQRIAGPDRAHLTPPVLYAMPVAVASHSPPPTRATLLRTIA